MASDIVTKTYKKWKHEKRRAIYFGRPNYEANCQEEIDDLLAQYPELSSVDCPCNACAAGNFEGANHCGACNC